MPDEVNDITQGSVEEVPEAPQPETLADAFKVLREAGTQPTQESVDEPKADDIPESNTSLGGYEPESADNYTATDTGIGSDENDTLESFDPNPARRALLQQANAYAQNQVKQMFDKQGVKLMDISDLYERDERNGTVTFRNPDNPNRPFENRFEAQQFCDSINKQINTRYQQEVRKAQQQAIQAMAPQFALLDFAPTYQAMSKTEQEIFDALIEPYSLVDKSGQVVGFQCNLNMMGQQAKKFASKFSTTSETNRVQPEAAAKQKAQKPTTPALDMPSAAGSSADDDEPKTLEEAFSKLNKIKKGSKK